MTVSSPGSERRQLSWPQFTIRDLLVATAIVAVELMLYRQARDGWWRPIVVTLDLISLVIGASLVIQVRDFARLLRGAPLSTDERWGLRFAIAVRLAVIVLLATHHLWERGLPRPDFGLMSSKSEVLYCVALVMVLMSTRQLAARARTRRHKILRWLGGIGVAATAVASTYLVRELMHIPHLVHRALVGIEDRILLTQGIDTPAAERAEQAFWLSIFTPWLIPCCFWLIYLCARRDLSPRQSRWMRIALAIVFPGYVGLCLWNYFVALPRASPFLVWQVPEASMWAILIVGLPCFLVLTSAIAYRWTGIAERWTAIDDQQSHRGPYWHEQRWLLGLLALTMSLEFAAAIWLVVDDTTVTFMEVLLYDTVFPARVAVFILAYSAICAGWNMRHELPPALPLKIPMRRFCIVWLAVALSTLLALPVLASFGFALWLAPAYIY